MSAPDTRDEIDLRAYLVRLVARWWIVVGAVIIAVAIAFWNAREPAGPQRTASASALVYVGQPLTSGGQTVGSNYTANPTFLLTIVRQDAVRDAAARAAGVRSNALKGKVSIQAVQAQTAVKGTAAPLVQVIVRGSFRADQAAAAANSFASQMIEKAGEFQIGKRQLLQRQIDADNIRLQQLRTQQEEAQAALDAINDQTGLSAIDRVALQTPYQTSIASAQSLEFQLLTQNVDRQADLLQVDKAETPRIYTKAVGSIQEATGKRANVVVAVALGLVAGVLLALLSTVVRPLRSEDRDAREPDGRDAAPPNLS